MESFTGFRQLIHGSIAGFQNGSTIGTHIVAMNGKGPVAWCPLLGSRHKISKGILPDAFAEDIKPIHILSSLSARCGSSMPGIRFILLASGSHRDGICLKLGLRLQERSLITSLRQFLQLWQIHVIPIRPTGGIHHNLSLSRHNLLRLIIYIIKNTVAGSKHQHAQACNGHFQMIHFYPIRHLFLFV